MLLIVLCALVAAASAGFLNAAPALYAHAPAVYAHAPVIYAKAHIGSTQHKSQDTIGQYNYGVAQGDGTVKSESRDIAGNVAGHFGYTSPEGARIETSYTAGAGGFQAVGNAIPQPVAHTPEVIAATNEHLAAKAHAYATTGYGYAAPAISAYAHPLAYAHHAPLAYAHHAPLAYAHHAPLAYAHHAPLAYAHAPISYAHHVKYALPSSFGYKFHA